MGFDPAYYALASQTWAWRVELLSRGGDVIRTLTTVDDTDPVGITGGNLAWNIHRPVRDDGSLDLVLPAELATAINWDQTRTRVGLDMVEPASISHNLGVFLPTVSEIAFSGRWASCQLDLHGRTTDVMRQRPTRTVGLPKGTVITDAVATLLTPFGRVSITPSPTTLSADRDWELSNEVTLLRIVNDLLADAGYFALYADSEGWMRADPYTPPDARVPRETFADGPNGMYTRGWTLGTDTWDVPNRVTVVQRVDPNADTAPLVVTVQDVESPYGYTSRGGRWVDAELLEANGSTLADLEAAGRRKLVELQTTSQTLGFTHVFLPLVEHDAVVFQNAAAGVDATWTLAKRDMSIGGPVLVKAGIRRVR